MVIMYFLFIHQGFLPCNALPYRTRLPVPCQWLHLVFSIYLVHPSGHVTIYISRSVSLLKCFFLNVFRNLRKISFNVYFELSSVSTYIVVTTRSSRSALSMCHMIFAMVGIGALCIQLYSA